MNALLARPPVSLPVLGVSIFGILALASLYFWWVWGPTLGFDLLQNFCL